MEGVRGILVEHQFRVRVAGTLERGHHALDGLVRDAAVGATVEREHRLLDLRGDVDRMVRRVDRGIAHHATVPGHTGLDLRVARGIQPGDAATPAKARDADFLGMSAICCRPRHRGIEVRHHLRVRHLAHHVLDEARDVGVLGRIALPCIQLGRDREVTRLRKATADILDVLVHAEDLLHHQHGRQPSLAGRCGAVGGHLAVRCGDLHFAGGQSLGIGGDHGLCVNWHDCCGEPGSQRGGDKAATSDVVRGMNAIDLIARVLSNPVAVFHEVSLLSRCAAGERARV